MMAAGTGCCAAAVTAGAVVAVDSAALDPVAAAVGSSVAYAENVSDSCPCCP